LHANRLFQTLSYSPSYLSNLFEKDFTPTDCAKTINRIKSMQAIRLLTIA
jgi:hypothetical protein